MEHPETCNYCFRVIQPEKKLTHCHHCLIMPRKFLQCLYCEQTCGWNELHCKLCKQLMENTCPFCLSRFSKRKLLQNHLLSCKQNLDKPMAFTIFQHKEGRW